MGRVLALIPTATLALPAELPVLPGGVAVPEGSTVSHGEPEWLGWGWAGNSRVLSAAGGWKCFWVSPHHVCLQKCGNGFTAPDVFIGTSVTDLQ